MHLYSKEEKWILNQILFLKSKKNMQSIFLSDICTAFLKHELVNINYNKKLGLNQITYYFDGEKYKVKEFEKIDKKREEIENKILNAVFLFKSLKEKNLLFEIPQKIKSEEFDIKPQSNVLQNKLRSNSNLDNNTQKFVVESLVNKRYYIRQEFADFVSDGFKTQQDKRYKNNLIATWTGILIAILVGVFSIAIGVVTSSSPVNLNSHQIEKIENAFSKVNHLQMNSLQLDSVAIITLTDSLGSLNKNIYEQDSKHRKIIQTNTDRMQLELKEIKSILFGISNDSLR